MNKKIYLDAFIRGNLGDDLFVKVICERYPNTQFIIADRANYKHFFDGIKNLTYIPHTAHSLKKSLYFRLKSLNIDLPYLLAPPKADAHVEIGGSIFLERHYWKILYKKRVNFVKRYKKCYTLGANWGPHRSEEFFDTYKAHFSTLEDICFRDKYSANLFKDLPNVRQADDVVFQLKHPKRTEENYYVISVIDCTDRPDLEPYHNDYIKKIVEVTDKITKKGCEVILMGFCTFQNDDKAIEDIYKNIENKEKVSIYHHDNINTSLDILAKSKGIIATRFHAMILGFLFSKPTIPLIYCNKMLTVLEDTKFPGKYYELKNIAHVNAEELIEHLEKKVDFDIQPMIKGSEAQFQELDKLLLP